MKTLALRWAVWTLPLLAAAHAQQAPAAAEILATLRPAHPRLIATDAEFAALRERVADPKVAPLFATIRAQAEAMLAEPPSTHDIPDGKRLLATSRRVKERARTLGLLHQLTGEARYAERLWREMAAVAAFPDWNPSHFLDTAEMTFAVAIALDWLHAAWTPEQRATIRAALVKHGLRPALASYRKPGGGIGGRTNNWNQVCNGGAICGALALAENEPELAGEILQNAVASLPRAMRHFAPDGAWNEGPVYWDYATEYNAQLDLGSFVLDALGQRWAMDPGPEDYNRPGYFGAERWSFYRCRAEGNNCFVLNPGAAPDQAVKAFAPIERFVSEPARAFALADLTAAYAPHAASARRGIALLERRRVLVQDEVRTREPAEYRWFMHTHAAIALAEDGATATLTQGGETLTARLLAPVGARFTIAEAARLPTSPPDPPAAARPHLKFGKPPLDEPPARKLAIHLPGITDVRVAVLLDPAPAADAPPAILPLSAW